MQKIKYLFEFYYCPQMILKSQKFNSFKYYELIILSFLYCLIHTRLFLINELTIFNPAFLIMISILSFCEKCLIRAGIIKLLTKTNIKYTNILKTLTVSYILIGIIVDIFNCIGQYYGFNIIEFSSIFVAAGVRIIYVIFITIYYLKDVLKAQKWFLILYVLDACATSVIIAVTL